MPRQQVHSGAPWEDEFGYARAVRVGNQVHVSGTTAVKDGEVVAPDDAGRQAEVCLDIIADALEETGLSLDDVVRTRIYLTDIEDQAAVGAAHGDAFDDTRPAITMVAIDALVDPDMRVEIEATAVTESAG